jgi:hypothetical protein
MIPWQRLAAGRPGELVADSKGAATVGRLLAGRVALDKWATTTTTTN